MKNKSRIVVWLCLVLAVLMVVSVMPIGAISAATEDVIPTEDTPEQSGNTDEISINTGNPTLDDTVSVGQPGEGYTPDGTPIASAAEFAKMERDGHYYLSANITVTTTFAGFAGVFDGNGHTVTVSKPLFSAPKNATIKNLTVKGSVASVKGGNTGVVASGTSSGCNFFNILNEANVTLPATGVGDSDEYRASGIAGRTNGYTIFERCTNTGSIAGNTHASGIVALPSNDPDSEAIFVNCVNMGTVTSAKSMAGGIACGVECSNGETLFYRCRNEGAVTGYTSSGGIAAYANVISDRVADGQTASVRFADCTNAGVITSSELYAGGIIGRTYISVRIERCTNEESGKIVCGPKSTNNQRMAAGIIAKSEDGDVLLTDCVNKAEIEGSGQTGGIAGYLFTACNITVRNCRNDGNVTSRLNYAGGIVCRADHNTMTTDEKILIEDCTNHGNITSYQGQSGGIFGYGTASVTFRRCRNTGEVTYREDTAKFVNAGGILGGLSAPAVFEGCRNEGNVTANNTGRAGGIAGGLGDGGANGPSKLIRCINTGNVTGGLSGNTENPVHNESYAGGLIGYQYCASTYSRTEISYCLSIGNVTARNQVSYGIGYMNGAAALFKYNVFAGKLTATAYSEGVNGSGSPVRLTLAWNQGYTVDVGHYVHNYVSASFDGAIINNVANTGAGNPVTMDGYEYTYPADKTALEVYEELLAQAEAEPQAVSTSEQFLAMKSDGRYKLTADLTLTGTYSEKFSGVLDGNEHTLTISAPVFEFLNAASEVYNLTIKGSVTGTGVSGALANNGGGRITDVKNYASVTTSDGHGGGLIGTANGQFAWFTGCENHGNVTVSTVHDAGGIIGYSNYTSYFVNCLNSGKIQSANQTGGIVGEAQQLGMTYTGCVNTGEISNTSTGGNKGAGGIQGYNGTSYCYFTDCYNGGKVSGVFAGGIIGDSAKGFVMSGCVNTGEIVSATTAAGGIYNHHNDNGCVKIEATNCINIGTIQGVTAGGIAGFSGQMKATGCILTSCINLGKVEGSQARQVAALLGYVYGVSDQYGCTVTNCIAGGTVTGKGGSCAAVCGYMNGNTATIKNNILIATLNATNTYLYYGTNGAAFTAAGNIANNTVKSGIAKYDAYKGNGTTKYELGTQSTDTITMDAVPLDTTVTKKMLLVAKILPDENGIFPIAQQQTLFENNGNKVVIYNKNGEELAVVGSLSAVGEYLTDGAVVKLLADYYSAGAESILSNGVSYTLDANGYKMYSAANPLAKDDMLKFALSFDGNGKVLVKNLTLYSQFHGLYVGRIHRVKPMEVTLDNVKLYVAGSNEDGVYINQTAGRALRSFSSFAITEIKGEETVFRNASVTLVYIAGGVVNFYDGTYKTQSTAMTTENNTRDMVNIYGGTFESEGAPDALINVAFGTVNISGGKFTSNGMCVARVLGGATKDEYGASNTITTETNATLNISGGEFVLKAGNRDETYDAVVRCGGGKTYGTVNISGGTFINQKTKSNQVVNKNNTCATLNLTGGMFLATDNQTHFMKTNGCANIQTASGYKPSDFPSKSVEIDRFARTYDYEGNSYKMWMLCGVTDQGYAMQTQAGAQVRLVPDSTGLRFISTLEATKVAEAEKRGTVSYGTVIAPLDYVTRAGAFTMEALKAAGLDYLDIEAKTGLTVDDDGNVEIRAAITGIKPTNYTRAFAAVAYVRVETAEGNVLYFYGEFDSIKNARSIREVATAALSDTNDEKTDKYIYEVTDDDGNVCYSPYSNGAREILQSFMPKSEATEN